MRQTTTTPTRCGQEYFDEPLWGYDIPAPPGCAVNGKLGFELLDLGREAASSVVVLARARVPEIRHAPSLRRGLLRVVVSAPEPATRKLRGHSGTQRTECLRRLRVRLVRTLLEVSYESVHQRPNGPREPLSLGRRRTGHCPVLRLWLNTRLWLIRKRGGLTNSGLRMVAVYGRRPSELEQRRLGQRWLSVYIYIYMYIYPPAPTGHTAVQTNLLILVSWLSLSSCYPLSCCYPAICVSTGTPLPILRF